LTAGWPAAGPESWTAPREARSFANYAALTESDRRVVQARTDGLLTVVAFDPGGTTGWSVMDTRLMNLSSSRSIAESVQGWWHGQIPCNEGGDSEKRGISAMETLVEQQWARPGVSAVAVVMEGFDLRTARRDRETLSPIRIIAGLEQLLWETGQKIWFQQPSDKPTCNDNRLRNWHFYAADGQEHARDADRHALFFLRRLQAKKALLGEAFPVLKL
jgi:hypothetical protein